MEKNAVATREQQIQQLLKPTVEAMGFELWGVEYLAQGRHTLLRVYIDETGQFPTPWSDDLPPCAPTGR